MALVDRTYKEDRQESRIRGSLWNDDKWLRDWDDWPVDWPQPGELLRRFRSESNHREFLDWPSHWPRMDTVVPRFSSHLDQMDRNWRTDPFWRDLYPRWAEPIFKEGIDLKSKIVNDSNRFAVEVDAYQFKPEEIQVKTLDDTLLIEGRHEDVRDRENFTKMYFVRKYQLPTDVEPVDVTSSIDSNGRLTVEAKKKIQLTSGRERVIPIESASRGTESQSHTNVTQTNISPKSRDEDIFSNNQQNTQQNIQKNEGQRSYRAYLPPSRSQSSGYYHHVSKSNRPINNRFRSREESLQKENGEYQSRHEQSNQFRTESKNEYRSESQQSERRHEIDTSSKIRSDSPSSSSHISQTMKTTNIPITTITSDPARSESRSESVRSIQILRKTFG